MSGRRGKFKRRLVADALKNTGVLMTLQRRLGSNTWTTSLDSTVTIPRGSNSPDLEA